MKSSELVEHLAAQDSRDALWEKAKKYRLLPVREFAELIRVAPQLVYYRLRNHRFDRRTCPTCGTEGLIDVGEAVRTFPTQLKALEAEEGFPRELLEAEETDTTDS